MRQLTSSEASNDEMRKQRFAFEDWWATQRSVVQKARVGSVDGPYRSKAMQSAWQAWQAALKSKQGEV